MASACGGGDDGDGGDPWPLPGGLYVALQRLFCCDEIMEIPKATNMVQVYSIGKIGRAHV